MTTSPYTPVQTDSAPAIAGRQPGRHAVFNGAIQASNTVGDRLRAAAAVPRNWRLVELVLDLVATAFILAAFADPALPADLMFHFAFVVLVLHAFLFGLRGTLLRIGLVSIPLIVYAYSETFGIDLPEMELAEWPLMFVIALLVAWMADRRASTSRRYAALFRGASERLLIVEEGERRRIAAELHDGVGQVLTALTLTLDAAAGAHDGRTVRARVQTARGLAETALAGTRDLAHRMRPARLEERGLIAAIRDLSAMSGFAVTVTADPPATAAARNLAPNTTVEIYRIVQESLANAARHSGADSARVSITQRHGRLAVEIADGGVGFETAAVTETGIGLAGMAERARLVGGHLSIRSTPGKGTAVTVSVPVPHAESGAR